MKKAKRSDGLASGAPVSSTRAARLAWLVEHHELWKGAPSDREDVDERGREILHHVGETMVQLGLYSPRTLRSDRVWALRVLIGEARKRLALA